MKRLVLLLLLFCMLVGCGKLPTQVPQTESTTVTTAPETEPTPGLMDNREPFGEDGLLYYVPNETLEGRRYQSLYQFGDDLLTSVQVSSDEVVYELRLAILDMDTGLPIHEATVPDVEYATVQVSGTTAAVCDGGTGDVILFDSTLQEIGRCKVATDWNTLCVNPAMTTAYSFTPEGGIQTMDIASGEAGVLLEGAHNLYISSVQQDTVSFSYLDPDTQLVVYGILNLDTSEIRQVDIPGDFMQLQETSGTLLAGLLHQDGAYLLGAEDDLSVIHLESIDYANLQAGGMLCVTSYDGDSKQSIRLYDAEGQFLSACSIPTNGDEYISDTLIWSEQYGGYFFTITSYSSATKLIFWDMSVAVTGDDLPRSSYTELVTPAAGQAVAAELYDRAGALSETYGVRINIAELCPTEYFTYTVEQNFDYWQISAGLDALDTALGSYPEGFLPQLLHDYSREIEIELVGTLSPTDLPDDIENGFSEFAAFVETQSGKIYMVMDLNHVGSFVEHCYHEISHMIDSKLAFDSTYREDALYSELQWASLNPEGFEYAFSYYDVPESFYSDGYDSYFIDIYARTFPTEDRARVLEYAMSGWTWRFEEESSALRAKLQYYADCIRDAFDTTGWPEVTKWEEALTAS